MCGYVCARLITSYTAANALIDMPHRVHRTLVTTLTKLSMATRFIVAHAMPHLRKDARKNARPASPIQRSPEPRARRTASDCDWSVVHRCTPPLRGRTIIEHLGKAPKSVTLSSYCAHLRGTQLTAVEAHHRTLRTIAHLDSRCTRIQWVAERTLAYTTIYLYGLTGSKCSALQKRGPRSRWQI